MSIIRKLLEDKKAPAVAPVTTAPAQAPVKTKARVRAVVSNEKQHYPSDNIAQGDGFVASCVKTADNRPERSRGGSNNVHVSTLIGDKWCPRAHLIQTLHQQGQSSCVNSQLHIVWKLGRAGEKHVRDQFITMHGRDRVIGHWTCKCERTSHTGPGTNSNICEACGTGTVVYNELTLVDNDIDKVGNPDLIFIAEDEGFEVVEIKSIKKENFEALFKASPDHVLQCRSYVNLLRDKLPGKRVGGRVLYVAKDYV